MAGTVDEVVRPANGEGQTTGRETSPAAYGFQYVPTDDDHDSGPDHPQRPTTDLSSAGLVTAFEDTLSSAGSTLGSTLVL